MPSGKFHRQLGAGLSLCTYFCLKAWKEGAQLLTEYITAPQDLSQFEFTAEIQIFHKGFLFSLLFCFIMDFYFFTASFKQLKKINIFEGRFIAY